MASTTGRRRRRSPGCCRGRCDRTAPARSLGETGPGVRLGELGPRHIEVVRTLLERAGAPLTPGLVDEVAAVDVDGAGDAVEGVGDAVDGVLAEQEDVARPQLLAAGGRHRAGLVGAAAEEGVVLLAGVDADGRPHQVVV